MTYFTCCRADGTCSRAGNPYHQYCPEHAAWEVGYQNGTDAANWYPIDASNAARIAKGLDDGDPAVLDGFAEPDLSGEYTEADLLTDSGYVPHDGDLLRDELREIYLASVSNAFWDEIARRCRYYI